MSSNADADLAATVAFFSGLYTDHYCDVAAAILFIYDALVTTDREVAYFWTAKRTGASLLFFSNKWISVAVYIMGMVSFTSFPSDKRSVSILVTCRVCTGLTNEVCSCKMFQIAQQAMLVLQFVPGAVFSALRAYVLSNSKPLGLLVAALSLAPVGANLVFYGYQYSGETFPLLGCMGTDNTSAALDLRSAFVVISRVPLIAADIILIYITWTKLRRQVAMTEIRQSKKLALSDILFYNGVMYFVILSTLNVLHLVLTVTALAGTSVAGQSQVSQFTAPITAILISRFLLELQEANQAVVKLNADDPLHSSRDPYDSTPSFISSLGGFVNPALSARSDDDDDDDSQVHSHSEVSEEEDDSDCRVHARAPELAASLSLA